MGTLEQVHAPNGNNLLLSVGGTMISPEDIHSWNLNIFPNTTKSDVIKVHDPKKKKVHDL